MTGIIDGHYCPLSIIRSTRGSVVFHYRADVPLGLFDPLHLREVWYSCASTHRVLVFYLPEQKVPCRKNGGKSKEQVSIRDHCRETTEKDDTAQHQVSQQTQNMELNTLFFLRNEEARYVSDITPIGVITAWWV